MLDGKVKAWAGEGLRGAETAWLPPDADTQGRLVEGRDVGWLSGWAAEAG